MAFENLSIEELNELLHDAIEMQDITLYNRIKDILNERTARYE